MLSKLVSAKVRNCFLYLTAITVVMFLAFLLRVPVKLKRFNVNRPLFSVHSDLMCL